jgi:hypothetical protein
MYIARRVVRILIREPRSSLMIVLMNEVGTDNCGRLPTVVHGYVQKVRQVSDG